MKLYAIAAVVLFVNYFAADVIAASIDLHRLKDGERQTSARTQHHSSNSTASTQVSFLAAYDQKIIYLESSAYRGYWVYGEAGPNILGVQLPNNPGLAIRAKDQLIADVAYKWRIHYLGPSHEFALESMKYRNEYISSRILADDYYIFLVTLPRINYLKHVGSPAHDNDVEMRVATVYTTTSGVPTGGQFRFPASNDAYLGLASPKQFDGARYTTLSNTAQTWYIWIPEADDELVLVDTLDNTMNNQDATYSYSATVGMSKTNGQEISESLEISLSAELKATFDGGEAGASFGVTYSNVWKQQTSETWSVSTTSTYSTPVAAGDLLEVRQLIGHYGDNKEYSVRAKYFQFSNPNRRSATKQLVEGQGHDNTNGGDTKMPIYSYI